MGLTPEPCVRKVIMKSGIKSKEPLRGRLSELPGSVERYMIATNVEVMYLTEMQSVLQTENVLHTRNFASHPTKSSGGDESITGLTRDVIAFSQQNITHRFPLDSWYGH
jgi:hypothetical protein